MSFSLLTFQNPFGPLLLLQRVIDPPCCRLSQVSSQARQPDFHIHLRDRGEIPKECARQVGAARNDVARLEHPARC